MNIKRMLEELTAEDPPPTRLNPASIYEAGMRYRKRQTAKRSLTVAGAAVAVTIGAAGIAQAFTGRPLLPFLPGPETPTQPASTGPATPTRTMSPTPTPLGSPTAGAPPPVHPLPTAASAGGATIVSIACEPASIDVKEAIEEQGIRRAVGISCDPDHLLAKVDLVSSPVRVTLIVSLTVHKPADAAAVACSGKPGVCEEPGSAKLARQEGMLIAVSVSTDGRNAHGGSADDLRGLTLRLNSKL